jgi:hypothetical protein
MAFSIRSAVSLLAVALVATAFVAGCGTAIDDAKIEADLQQYIEDTVGKKVASVGCPSDVEVEKGKTFDCTVSLVGGEEETATVKILNEDADYELADLQPGK